MIWLVAFLSLALLLTGRVAFVAYRASQWAQEDRYNPHLLRDTLRRIVLDAERSGDLHALAETRDAMAAGFETAEKAFIGLVPAYERSQVIRTATLREIHLRSLDAPLQR